MNLTCFKAYDIRGRVPDELNEDIAYRIGRAFAALLSPGRVVVGFDIRLTSEALCTAVSRGLMEGGADVLNIGQCGTEEVYFATSHLKADGGIAVTASHNPKDYNGMKLVRENSRPISADTGLFDIKKLAGQSQFPEPEKTGVLERVNTKPAYIEHLLTYVDAGHLKPLKIVCNAGNGGAGPAIDLLEPHLPFELIKVHHKPDGHFPNGVPNPMLEENRYSTAAAIAEHQADIGIAWDGDFDRCFFFDADGRFIEGCYIVSLLAEMMLSKAPNARIVHDPRSVWVIQEAIKKNNGKAIQSKCGHTYIKDVMRSNDAVYGGEVSGHHYFRDFSYYDSGMIPWLLIMELMCHSGKSLKELLDAKIESYPCSGEINFTIKNANAAIERVRDHFSSMGGKFENIDGISYSFDDWRFNLRISNTESLVRLNIETKGDKALLEEKVNELMSLLV